MQEAGGKAGLINSELLRKQEEDVELSGQPWSTPLSEGQTAPPPFARKHPLLIALCH